MKNSKVTMIIIGIILVFLCCYYIIDKNSPKEKNIENNYYTSNEEIWNDLALFPETDKSIKTLTLSYDGVTCEEGEYPNCKEIDLLDNNKLNFNYNDFKIEFKCLDYYIDKDDKEYRYCAKNQIKLDNKVTFTFENNIEYEDVRTLIFKTSKNYIIKEANTIYGQGDLVIYDLNGKQIKKVDKTVTEFDVFPEEIDDEMQSKLYNPTISENKLYYVYSDYLNFENGLDNKVHLGYIDLDTLEYTETYSLKAVVSLGV